MNATPSCLTTEIKQFFKQEFNLTVCATKGLSKHPFYRVLGLSINPFYRVFIPGENKDTFPLNIRVMLLNAIYGDKEWTQSGNAGNIMPRYLSFERNDWNKFKELYNNQPR